MPPVRLANATCAAPLLPLHWLPPSSCTPRRRRMVPTSTRLVDGQHTHMSSVSSTFLHHERLHVGILRAANSDPTVTDKTSAWAHLRSTTSPPLPSRLLQPSVTGSTNRRSASLSRMTPMSSSSP
jgi:hypothetical protein